MRKPAPKKFDFDELMQLKRSEKPAPEFWESFDKELLVKQRRLLQQQPVDSSAFDNELWRRFKKITALCCAGISCAAFALLAFKSVQGPASPTTKTPSSEATPELAQTISAKQPDASRQTQSVFEMASHQDESARKPRFAEIERPAEHVTVAALARHAREQSRPSQSDLVAQIDPIAGKGHVTFSLELSKPFADFDLEKALAFNDGASDASAIMERYSHPLSDMGYQHRQFSSDKMNALDKMTRYAMDADLLDRDSRWGVKLDAVSLKF